MRKKESERLIEAICAELRVGTLLCHGLMLEGSFESAKEAQHDSGERVAALTEELIGAILAEAEETLERRWL